MALAAIPDRSPTGAPGAPRRRRPTLAELTNGVVAAKGAESRATARLVAQLTELDRLDAWRGEGYPSLVSWLMAQVPIPFAAARDLVTVARAVAVLPRLARALAAATVTFDQLRVLVRIATPDNDEELAAEAPRWSFSQTEEHVRAEEVRRADLARRRAREAERQRRELEAARSGLGSGPGPGTGPGATGGDLPAAPPSAGLLAPLTAVGAGPAGPAGPAMPDAPAGPGWLKLRPGDGGGYLQGFLPAERFSALSAQLHAVAETVGPVPGSRQRPPLAERLAVALVDSLGAPPATTRRTIPEIVVHADVGLLTAMADGSAVATTDSTGPMEAEVLRRLTCEATLRLAADVEGLTVDLGRSRRVPSRALAEEVMRRDRCCRFPGCTLTRNLQIHHLIPWTEGGPTDLSNLALHCYRDHHRLHHGGWTATGDANGELRYTSPEGQVLTSGPSPTWSEPRRRRRDGPSRS